ncbi:RsmE family RNA methyltransferase [Spiroplasma endosymbiont of Nebria brevicollis]|uniref:RsmE family RNA methyltransferase n=1 Tax=Spiroplasma endosymbiont of Nebria brevicollis TaxID=3066284 RepID=UPI00313AB482
MECYFTKDKADNTLILDTDDSNHAIKVMRHKINDEIIVIYEQQKYQTKIIITKPNVQCEIIKPLTNSNAELSCKITLVMALLKEQKFDYVIQKVVELGVHQIVPMQLKRCVSVLTTQKAEQKVARWQSIAKAAAKQANRNIIPIISPTVFMIKDLAPYKSQLNLVADENGNDTTWIACFNKKLLTTTIVIGPEGGITREEITDFHNLGFSSISLGKLILRAETAPLFLISIINYETNLKLKGVNND